MGGYIGSSVGNVANAAERKKTYSITTATTSLTGLAYTPTKVHVFHNGVRLVDSTDYTATNGTSITLTNAAQNGDEVVVISYPSFQVSDTVSAANGGTFAGNVTMSGNATVGGTLGSTGLITASAGVAIGGTGAVNTLDDYEEGTWTPVMTGASGSAGSAATTVYGATYTKIGNLVTVMCYIRFANVGSYSGNVAITGLPFTSANNGTRTAGTIDFLKRVELADNFNYSANIVANASVVQISRISSDQSTKAQAQVSHFNDNLNEIIFNCSYTSA